MGSATLTVAELLLKEEQGVCAIWGGESKTKKEGSKSDSVSQRHFLMSIEALAVTLRGSPPIPRVPPKEWCLEWELRML